MELGFVLDAQFENWEGVKSRSRPLELVPKGHDPPMQTLSFSFWFVAPGKHAMSQSDRKQTTFQKPRPLGPNQILNMFEFVPQSVNLPKPNHIFQRRSQYSFENYQSTDSTRLQLMFGNSNSL